jgi:hypothetical protein
LAIVVNVTVPPLIDTWLVVADWVLLLELKDVIVDSPVANEPPVEPEVFV